MCLSFTVWPHGEGLGDLEIRDKNLEIASSRRMNTNTTYYLPLIKVGSWTVTQMIVETWDGVRQGRPCSRAHRWLSTGSAGAGGRCGTGGDTARTRMHGAIGGVLKKNLLVPDRHSSSPLELYTEDLLSPRSLFSSSSSSHFQIILIPFLSFSP